jgi:thiamine-phosphate pyrophosphorylase
MTVKNTAQKKLKGLYAITDERLIEQHNFIQTVDYALQGGSKIIQYRDKSCDPHKRLQQAKALRSLCDKFQAILIINDDIELAAAVDADGVHLGKDDLALEQARQRLGSDVIIGISCYNDLNLAIEAEKKGANYVAFGAIFSSSTKPDARQTSVDIIKKAKQKINIPVCAIGGISRKNIDQITRSGADMAAVINDLFASDDIKNSAMALSRHFY